jgi:SAM-dependent methyltransferase
MSTDLRRFAPAAARNRDAIRDVLRRRLPTRGLVLEVASGSGEHITHVANGAAGGLVFQPSDPDPDCRASIDAWTKSLALTNVRPAIEINAALAPWPFARADAILNINMIHIAPWDAAVGLMQGAARLLPAGGMLYLYGPFRRDGGHTSAGNEAFDRDLRNSNAAWGVRDLEAVAALAADNGFGAPIIEAMPANNLSLIFRRQ